MNIVVSQLVHLLTALIAANGHLCGADATCTAQVDPLHHQITMSVCAQKAHSLEKSLDGAWTIKYHGWTAKLPMGVKQCHGA